MYSIIVIFLSDIFAYLLVTALKGARQVDIVLQTVTCNNFFLLEIRLRMRVHVN